jgi:hypothetical protein
MVEVTLFGKGYPTYTGFYAIGDIIGKVAFFSLLENRQTY